MRDTEVKRWSVQLTGAGAEGSSTGGSEVGDTSCLAGLPSVRVGFGGLRQKQGNASYLADTGVRSSVRKAGGLKGKASHSLLFCFGAAPNTLLSGYLTSITGLPFSIPSQGQHSFKIYQNLHFFALIWALRMGGRMNNLLVIINLLPWYKESNPPTQQNHRILELGGTFDIIWFNTFLLDCEYLH